MKRIRMLWIAMILSTAAAAAQQDLNGDWQGRLAVDAKTSLTVRFTFSKDARGMTTVVLNSPDNTAIKNTPATGVAWDGVNLKLQVAALGGSYSGVLKDGKLNGEWTQPGGKLPLILAPYQKPVTTPAEKKTLTGSWHGTAKVNGLDRNVVLRFKPDDKGEMTGTMTLPDQSDEQRPLEDIQFSNGKLDVRLAPVRGTYSGTLAGNQFNGMLKLPNATVPPEGIAVVFKRGDYVPEVHALKLTAEGFVQLAGKWQGTLERTPPKGQKVSSPVALRFEKNTAGQYVAFFDITNQRVNTLAITDASFSGGKLIVKVALMGAEYQATLSDKTLTGQWSQGNGAVRVPLTLGR
jgi:hypothetical protein